MLDELDLLRNSVGAHYLINGSYPTGFTQIGWEADTLYSDYGGMPISLYNDGIIAVGFGTSAVGDMYFVNEPIMEEGEIVWYCYGQNIAVELLPAACQ